jgi:UDP-N-acetylmuramyl pentapeptide synthase
MPPRDGVLTAIGQIVTDSRLVKAGDVFWGLKGPMHDGSHFADEALARGASGVVTAGRWMAPWAGGWSLQVDDSEAALLRLIAWSWRQLGGRTHQCGKNLNTLLKAIQQPHDIFRRAA